MTKKIERGEIDVSALIPYARNARTHSTEQIEHLARMIRELGFINPVVIDEKNNLIAGHGRIMAAQMAGITTVSFVRLIGFSETEKMRFRIEDNSVADMSGWDMETLVAELELLESDGYELDSFAFEDDLLKELDDFFYGDGITVESPKPNKSGLSDEYQKIAFTDHNDQADFINRAINKALKMPESDTGLESSESANALALICIQWLKSQRKSKGGA